LTLREVSRADVASEASDATLVDALLMARILIARMDADGRPTVRLAHDAVLASWPRASEAAQASREFYRVRADVEDAMRRWQEYGRPKDRLIQPGVPLAEAEKLVDNFGTELPTELSSFVRVSRNRARVRQRLMAAAAIFFFILTVAATGAGFQAYVSKQEAVRALKQAQTTQSLFLAGAARQQRIGGDAGTATLLSLEALPDSNASITRPYVPEPELQLDGAWRELRERLVLEGHEDVVTSAAFSPDGKRIVTASWDRTARLWDAETGKSIGEPLTGHAERVWSAGFSPDGKRIVTASWDKTARLWDAEISSLPSRRFGASSWRNGLTTPTHGNSGSATLAPAKTRRSPLPRHSPQTERGGNARERAYLLQGDV
jgi:hypothetical protein